MNITDIKLLAAQREELLDIVPKVLKACGEPEKDWEYHIKLALSDIEDSLISYRIMLKFYS